MIPRLYNSSTEDPNTEGLGSLKDLLSVSITRNYNQIPTLTITYPNNGSLSKTIAKDMIIVADIGAKDTEKNQKFRISDVSKGLGAITITANHIWADLSSIPLRKDVMLANATPEFAFNAIKNALAWQIPEISFYTDINTVGNVVWSFRDIDNANSALMGADALGDSAVNTMQTLYHGEFQFDNYKLSLLKHAGTDNDLVIKYGRNMQSITRDETTSGTYNAIMPYVTLSSNAETSSDEEITNQPAIQNLTNGIIRTYSSPNSSQEPADNLANGAFVQLVSKTSTGTVNGHTWYKTSTSTWIDERWITFDQSKKYLVNKLSATATLTANRDDNGIIVAANDDSWILYAGKDNKELWTSPFGGEASNEKLHNGQRYKICWLAKDLNGELWYNFGNLKTEWIPACSFYLTGDNVAAEKVYGHLTITDSVIASKDPKRPNMELTWKNVGTYMVYELQIDSDGHTWYHLGQFDGRQIWIKEGQNTNFAAVMTADDEDKILKQVPVYADPTGLTPTTMYYEIGSKLRITAQSFNRGNIFYEIGTNQWINSKFVTISSSNPVGETSVDEHTLTLTKPVIASDYALKTHAPLRVQAVDFSAYGIGDDKNRLLSVAKAYMKQNQIGRPAISLTVSYEQMQGAYKNLTSVDLYDYVGVIFDEVNIFEKAQCKSITWDPIREVATSITIGQLPSNYTHYLNQFVTSAVSTGTAEAKGQSTRLFNEAKEDAKKNDQKQIDAINVVQRKVDQVSESFDSLSKKVEQISTGMQNFLTGTQTGSIMAFPNWKNPTEIRAKTASGGYIRLDNQGLTNVNADGVETFKVGEFADKAGVMIDDVWLSKKDIDWIHKQQNSK